MVESLVQVSEEERVVHELSFCPLHRRSEMSLLLRCQAKAEALMYRLAK